MTRKHKPQNEQCLSLSPNPKNTYSSESSAGEITDIMKKKQEGKKIRKKYTRQTEQLMNGKEGREGLGSTQGHLGRSEQANPTVRGIQQCSKQSFQPHHPGVSEAPSIIFF